MIRALSAFALSLAVAGCGFRTGLSVAPPPSDGGAARDAAAPDSGRPDGGSRDAGRDGGARDAGPVVECRADRECADGSSCVADSARAGEDLEPMPLLCGALARGAADRSFCDDAAECARGLCLLAGTCVEPCIDDSDCEGDDGGPRVCLDVYARTGPTALQPFRGCVHLHDAPPDVTVAGPSMIGSVSPLTTSSLELPPPTSRTTYVVALDTDVLWQATRLATNDRRPIVLFDLEAAIDPFGTPPRNTVQLTSQTSGVLVPNGTRSVLSDAGYVLDVEAGGTANVSLLRFNRDRVASILDVDIYTVVSGGRSDAQLDTAVRAALGVLSLELGEVRHHRVVGGLRSRFGFIEAGPDEDLPNLDNLFRLSAGAGRPSIGIFFVGGLGDIAAGIAGGVPGPPGMQGTGSSGIAIAGDTFDPGISERLETAIAHELGHFFGLFHTSELSGIVVEPLDDTPECRLESRHRRRWKPPPVRVHRRRRRQPDVLGGHGSNAQRGPAAHHSAVSRSSVAPSRAYHRSDVAPGPACARPARPRGVRRRRRAEPIRWRASASALVRCARRLGIVSLGCGLRLGLRVRPRRDRRRGRSRAPDARLRRARSWRCRRRSLRDGHRVRARDLRSLRNVPRAVRGRR